MLTEFDLIIFDCDGVLIDSEVLSCECLAQLLREHGCEIDLQSVFEIFLGRSFSAVEEHYQLAAGRPLSVDFVEAHRTRLRASFAASLRPMAGIDSVLGGLQQQFCVASSSDVDRLSFCLGVTGLAQRFGERVYSADLVAYPKPAPDLFLHAAAAMGVEPSRSLVIEDSATGVSAGKAAGMTVWGFVGGSHHTHFDGAGMLAQAGADRILRDLADLQPR